MHTRTRSMVRLAFVLAIVLLLALAGCAPVAAPTPAPQIVKETVIVPQEVIKEVKVVETVQVEVIKEVVVTATPAPMPEPPKYQPELKNISFAMQTDPPFAPYSVAIKKGWFEEAGFESVTTKTFTAGALAGEALAAGQIQLWQPAQLPVINMRHNGIRVVIVGHMTNGFEFLTVRKDANVKNPEDLYNIKIGLLDGSSASAVLGNIAKYYGLDQTKLQVVNLPPPEQVTSFGNNDVQATLVWPPVCYQSFNAADSVFLIERNISHFEQDDGTKIPASYTTSPLVFGEAFLRQNPETAKAILAVVLKAQAWVADPANKDEAIQIHAETTGQTVEAVAQSWGDYEFDPVVDQDFIDAIQNYSDFLVAAGRIKDPQPVLSYVSTDLLKELMPEAVKIEGQWQP